MFKWKYSNWARILWTILRVYLGYNWLTSGFGKVFGANAEVWVGSQAGVAVTGFLKGALAKTGGAHPDVQPWYAWFINHIALPNAKIFGYMVAWGEFLVGIALILGMFTTLALLASLLMNFNYMFAGSVSVNPIFIIEALILLWAGWAAYYWSLDRLLWNRWHQKPFPEEPR
ncbi:MAG: DoxX family membrane protein [Syntrophomonadaceae bacterium]|nr:DoxX family membrane protein [Syntrophomonadaceae bacterium]